MHGCPLEQRYLFTFAIVEATYFGMCWKGILYCNDQLLNKNTRTRVDTRMIGTKKNTFQLELKNRFTALEEHDDMDSLKKNITEMIQQSALSIAKQTKKQKNPKISSHTRALMKKRREMIENKTPRDHIVYVEICKTIKESEGRYPKAQLR